MASLAVIALEACYQRWRRIPGNGWQDRRTFYRECPVVVAGILQRG